MTALIPLSLLSLAIPTYQPSSLVNPLNHTFCLHRADEYKFLLVGEN